MRQQTIVGFISINNIDSLWKIMEELAEDQKISGQVEEDSTKDHEKCFVLFVMTVEHLARCHFVQLENVLFTAEIVFRMLKIHHLEILARETIDVLIDSKSVCIEQPVLTAEMFLNCHFSQMEHARFTAMTVS